MAQPISLMQYKEVPQEVLFKISTAKRDPLISNRYWFKYPEQWKNQYDKESIIGFRSIYLTKHNRHVNFLVKCVMCDYTTGTTLLDTLVTVDFHSWLDTGDAIKKVCNDFYTQWNESINDFFKSPYYGQYAVGMFYEHENGKCIMRISVSPEYSLPRSVTVKGVTYDLCIPMLYLESMSEETGILLKNKRVYKYNDDRYNTYTRSIEFDVWDRHQCYLRSSISNEAEDNFLGHSRTQNNIPIKYYRITSSNDSWWVELYSTRDHRCKVEFPEDKLDDLYIEAIVCFSSSAMI